MDSFYLALLLYFAALTLAAIDIFVPSGGLLVVFASLSAIGSVLFGFRSGTNMGMTMLTLVIASIPALIFTAIKVWPHTPIGRRAILGLPAAAAPDADQENLQALIGHVLRAESALLPSGHLRIGHRRFNAMAESGYIEADSRVKVIAVRERNLIVRTTAERLSVSSQDQASKDALNHAERNESLLDQPADQFGLDSLEDQ